MHDEGTINTVAMFCQQEVTLMELQLGSTDIRIEL
jgi:hypothetical protein